MRQVQEFTYEVATQPGIYVAVNPFFEGQNFSRSKEFPQIYDRFESGSLKFFEKDYDFVKEMETKQNETGLRMFQNGVLQYDAILNLQGNYNDDTKIVNLNMKVDDHFTNIEDENTDEKNFIDGGLELFTVISETDTAKLTFKLDINFTDPISSPVGSIWDSYTLATLVPVFFYARQERTVINFVADEIIGTDGWVLLIDNGDGTSDIVRDWTDTSLDTPSFGVNWGIYEDLSTLSGRTVNQQINGGIYTHFVEDLEISVYHQVGLFNEVYYGELKRYTRNRKLFDVLIWLVGEIDSSIQFEDNEVPATTDSFDFMKTFQNSESQFPFKLLMLSVISDFILTGAGTEKDEPSTIGLITFTKIMQMLNRLSIFWTIEVRGSTPYFITKYKPDINIDYGLNPNPSNHFGIDWLAGKNEYEFDTSKQFRQLVFQNDNSGGNVDFLQNTVIVPKISDNKIVTKPTGSTFYDIWDMQNNPSDYPFNGTNSYVLIATEKEIIGDEISLVFANVSYDTFTWVDPLATAIQASGLASAQAIINTLVRGDAIVLDVDIAGTGSPRFQFGGFAYELQTGNNLIYLRAVTDSFPKVLQIQSFTAANFTITFNSVKLYVHKALKTTGALSDELVVNAALSNANTVDEHLSDMADKDVVVNGVEVLLPTNRVVKLRKQEFKIPINNLKGEICFEDLIGKLEIDDVSGETSQGSFTVSGRF